MTGAVSMAEMTTISAHHELGLPDPLTGLQAQTYFGRPNFQELFNEWSSNQGGDVGVVFCGPRNLGSQLRHLCSQMSSSKGTTFHYSEEHF